MHVASSSWLLGGADSNPVSWVASPLGFDPKQSQVGSYARLAHGACDTHRTTDGMAASLVVCAQAVQQLSQQVFHKTVLTEIPCMPGRKHWSVIGTAHCAALCVTLSGGLFLLLHCFGALRRSLLVTS